MLVEICQAKGIEVRVGCTVRGPMEQGKLWCRSRTVEEVASRRRIIGPLAPTMASYLRDEWAGLGPRMTEHLPGQSWHQWGQAADIYAVVGEKAIWEGCSLIKSIAEFAQGIGLYHSLIMKAWEPKARHHHVQLRKDETPLMNRRFCENWGVVEEKMAERFSE